MHTRRGESFLSFFMSSPESFEGKLSSTHIPTGQEGAGRPTEIHEIRDNVLEFGLIPYVCGGEGRAGGPRIPHVGGSGVTPIPLFDAFLRTILVCDCASGLCAIVRLLYTMPRLL